jgi:small-conductance mechanosensitive channel
MNLDLSRTLEQLESAVLGILSTLPSLIAAVLILAAFWGVGTMARRLVYRLTNRVRRRRNLGVVLGRITHWIVVLLGVLTSAVVLFPNFSASEVIQLLGLGSLAIGFAFRDVLQNFLVGILLLINEPFSIGDQIIVNNGQFEGTVEDIDGRATIIRTYDGRRVVVPNADLYTGTVTVNTAFDRRRVDYDVAISYGSDIDLARRIILEAIREADVETVLLSPPPQVYLTELGDFGVTLRLRWWISPPLYHDFIDSRDRILSSVMRRIAETDGVSIPFPTRTVWLKQTEGVPTDATQ